MYIAQETCGFLDPPLPGDMSDHSHARQKFRQIKVNCQATLTRIPYHEF